MISATLAEPEKPGRDTVEPLNRLIYGSGTPVTDDKRDTRSSREPRDVFQSSAKKNRWIRHQ